MNSEEKKITSPQGELTDDELEEISGGLEHRWITMCRCPKCNATSMSVVGSDCPTCLSMGVKSPMVKA